MYFGALANSVPAAACKIQSFSRLRASDCLRWRRLTKSKDQETIIINRPGRSTYPDEKSVLRSEATPDCHRSRLTVKLRGRPGAPEQTPRAHNLFRARGDTTDSHGTLERWLGGGGDGARANGCFKIR